MVRASWLRDAPGARRAAFADTFNAAEVMVMPPGDRNAHQAQQALAGGATLDHERWKTGQPAREDDTQTVTPGAARLQATPMAWQTRTRGSHAL